MFGAALVSRKAGIQSLRLVCMFHLAMHNGMHNRLSPMACHDLMESLQQVGHGENIQRRMILLTETFCKLHVNPNIRAIFSPTKWDVA